MVGKFSRIKHPYCKCNKLTSGVFRKEKSICQKYVQAMKKQKKILLKEDDDIFEGKIN